MILFVLSAIVLAACSYYLLIEFGLSLVAWVALVLKNSAFHKATVALLSPQFESAGLLVLLYAGLMTMLFPTFWPLYSTALAAPLVIGGIALLVRSASFFRAKKGSWLLGLTTLIALFALTRYFSISLDGLASSKALFLETFVDLFTLTHWATFGFVLLLSILSGALVGTYRTTGAIRRSMSAILNLSALILIVYSVGFFFALQGNGFGNQLFESAQPNFWLFIILLALIPVTSRLRDANALRSLHPALIVSALYLYFAAQFPYVLRGFIMISDMVQGVAYRNLLREIGITGLILIFLCYWLLRTTKSGRQKVQLP